MPTVLLTLRVHAKLDDGTSMRLALSRTPLTVRQGLLEGVKMKKKFTAPRLVAESSLTEITLFQAVSGGQGGGAPI